MAEKEDGKKVDPSKVDIRLFIQKLKCELTDKEHTEAAVALAEALDDMTAAESEKKSLVEQFKARIEAANAEAVRLTGLVRNRYEFRDIQCEEVKNFQTGQLTVTREDTSEIVKERELTMEEKQRPLGLED